METRHFKTGVAKDSSAPAVPDTVLAKLIAMFEAKLRRKKAGLIPLVPRKPSVEVIKKTSTNRLKKRPEALNLHSNQSHPSSLQPGTPTSQNSDAQTPREPRKLRKRSRSLARSSPESIAHSLPVPAPIQTPPLPAQAQVVTMRDRDWDKVPEAVLHRPTARLNLGPPPSPSHGKRFESMGVPRRNPEKVTARPPQVGLLHPGRGRSTSQDGEIVLG